MEIIQFINADDQPEGLYLYEKYNRTPDKHQEVFDSCIETCKTREAIFYKVNRDPEEYFDFKSALEVLLDEAGYTRMIHITVKSSYI